MLQRSIAAIQDVLNYKGSSSNFQFAGDGIGKIGTTGFLLGFVGGLHFAFLFLSLVVVLSIDDTNANASLVSTLWTLIHWSMYTVSLCTFHFMEFFATARYQPSSLSYDCTFNENPCFFFYLHYRKIIASLHTPYAAILCLLDSHSLYSES